MSNLYFDAMSTQIMQHQAALCQLAAIRDSYLISLQQKLSINRNLLSASYAFEALQEVNCSSPPTKTMEKSSEDDFEEEIDLEDSKV